MSEIYGDHLPRMQEILKRMLDNIEQVRNQMKSQTQMDPVEHCLGRIKSEESMSEKCRRRGLPETPDSALHQIKDGIGIRVVCAFLDDVYAIRDAIAAFPDCRIVEEKDYIHHVKPNGYRSYHLILLYQDQYYVEFQLRTISQDTWAALEHHIRYKKEIGSNTKLIVSELKRCADELASTDISMQAIKDMIFERSHSME